MIFRIGMKVACIRDDWAISGYHPTLLATINELPRKGGVYRISSMADCPFNGVPHLALEGIQSRLGDVWFEASWFRPLIERKTEAGVETLRKLQDPNNHTVPLPEDREAFEHALLEIFDEALR